MFFHLCEWYLFAPLRGLCDLDFSKRRVVHTVWDSEKFRHIPLRHVHRRGRRWQVFGRLHRWRLGCLEWLQNLEMIPPTSNPALHRFGLFVGDNFALPRVRIGCPYHVFCFLGGRPFGFAVTGCCLAMLSGMLTSGGKTGFCCSAANSGLISCQPLPR